MKYLRDLKKKVLACAKICGTHISLNDPVICEILGYAGFDFLWIDTEHTSIDYNDLLRHLSSARMTATPALVRVHINDYNHVKRVLEMGPDGIIFPMISTAAEADSAMKSCMYPPDGRRGFGPLGAVRYGYDDVNEYINMVNNKLCRFIQIETKETVDNLPEIIKNPYIDGYIFGPCDLSGSVGELNNVFGDNTVLLIKKSIEIIKNAGKCIGISIGSDDVDTIGFWHGMGINMISSGVDYNYLLRGAKQNLSNIKKIFSE